MVEYPADQVCRFFGSFCGLLSPHSQKNIPQELAETVMHVICFLVPKMADLSHLMGTTWGPKQPRSFYYEILPSSLTSTIVITAEGNNYNLV
jgi:hypothetical protein